MTPGPGGRALELEDGPLGVPPPLSPPGVKGAGGGLPPPGPPEPLRNLVAFWLLGLFNNASYVILLAGANSISEGAVGGVYLAAVVPAALVKLSAPYWFHLAPYPRRVCAAAALTCLSYLTVAAGASRAVQLAGVALASLQGGLGEASCLALTSRYSGAPAITAWSSGTGFAGVFGYGWVAALHLGLGLPFPAVLMAANVTALGFLAAFFWLLQAPAAGGDGGSGARPGSPRASEAGWDGAAPAVAEQRQGSRQRSPERQRLLAAGAAPDHLSPRGSGGSGEAERRGPKALRLSLAQRAQHVATLWPYAVPLAVVYFAEYAMQSGTWAAIGFPVDSAEARHQFYVWGNAMYQVGVFVSRSSGMHCQASMAVLWAMPALQLLLLLFFLAVAALRPAPLYGYGLLGPCLLAGLLGGAVYVNAFTLLSRRVEPGLHELSLAAVSLADSAGVALADVAGVLIQGCLFRVNGLSGADFRC